MENKAHALAAGLFVLALSALLGVLAYWLTRDVGIRLAYEITTREAVSGLQPQAPVRYRGVNVGKVTSIGFDPVDRYLRHIEQNVTGFSTNPTVVFRFSAKPDFASLKGDGTLVCWGHNFYRQCDNPVAVTHVVQVSAGLSHTAAALAPGLLPSRT